MFPLQFVGQNVQFAISLFAALVFFAVFWLYFDAWTSKKPKATKDVYKWAGFLLVSVSFLIHSTQIESNYFGNPLFGDGAEKLASILRLLGYLGIIIGQLVDPLQQKPKTSSLEENLAKTPAIGASSYFGTSYVLPFGALAIAGLYLRRATTGLEKHLKPIAIGFGFLFLYDVTSLSRLWRDTTNPNVFDLVKAFGPVWIISYILLLIAAAVLGRWVWRYLTERFQSQLFMIFTCSILAIFLLTTVSFTYLLQRNVHKQSLDNLSTAASVLNYALDSKKAETKADAEALAQNPQIVQAVISKDHSALVKQVSDELALKKISSLVITTDSAQVLVRAENPDRWGDSISSDPLVRRALLGTAGSTITSSDGVLAPVVSIKSAAPIRQNGKIMGTVTVSLTADNAFVDGIKSSTGLDSSIYSGSKLSATTLHSTDSQSRSIGVQLNDSKINSLVLAKGQTFSGNTDLFNRQFLAVYRPLKDVNNNVIGMIFIGQPQVDELKTAGRSIELTFVVTAFLIILSVFPAYFVSKQIAKQLE